MKANRELAITVSQHQAVVNIFHGNGRLCGFAMIIIMNALISICQPVA
jgi:hypothetical protein